jgi:uncharacterized membrane protein (DUF4010 family)
MDNLIINTDAYNLSQLDFIIRLLVTIGIGLLIGLEREYSALKEQVESFAGIRTFVFVALLGFIGGLSYFLLSPAAFVAVLAAVVILTGISYYVTSSKGEVGATTEFSALITFFLGVLAFLGFIEITLMITVLVVVILSSKVRLHNIIGKITAEELYDFIRFVVMALLIFPFLPNQNYGPYDVLNPREIGWVILLTSGIGFVGYILMRALGSKKGILLSGIVGGLISSTAVTWVFAKKSKENEAISHHCASAILAASSIMILRILIWTFLFNKGLFSEIYITVILVFLAAAGVTLFLYFKNNGKPVTDTEIRQGKPLDLRGSLVFGAIYTAILLLVSYSNDFLGDAGLLISSAIGGLSDVDAIAITLSKMAGTNINLNFAANALFIATIANTLVKLGIGLWAGSKTLRRELIMGYTTICLALLFALLL